MEITISLLTKKFNEYNATYFDGQIPMVNFTFSNTANNLGLYYPRTHTIRITKFYKDITEHDVEEILIHEMIHAWQHKTNNEDRGHHYHHGPKFYQKANAINAQSNGYFHISRCTTLSQETKNGSYSKAKGAKNPFIIGRKNGDSSIYVGKVTEAALQTFPQWLGKYYDHIEFFYVKEEHAKKFADFVISRSRFNYRKFSEKDFNEKFVPCISHKGQFLSARR